jgi:hypothetical protein
MRPNAQVLDITIVNCGGLRDLMSEMEASFLVSALGLFRNVQNLGRAKPRANVNLLRAYDAKGFYDAAMGNGHLLHVIGHASKAELEVSYAKVRVKASQLGSQARRRGSQLPPIVVATGCEMQSASWQRGMRDAGASVLIASETSPSPAALTSFDMAFYSALLAQQRRGKSLLDRVSESFTLADAPSRDPRRRHTLCQVQACRSVADWSAAPRRHTLAD